MTIVRTYGQVVANYFSDEAEAGDFAHEQDPRTVIYAGLLLDMPHKYAQRVAPIHPDWQAYWEEKQCPLYAISKGKAGATEDPVEAMRAPKTHPWIVLHCPFSEDLARTIAYPGMPGPALGT